MMFTLRHRQGNRGVQLSMIELTRPTEDAAINLRLAEEIGKAYCNRMLNSLFIRVEAAVVADESILSPVDLRRILNPPKPKPKQRLGPNDQVPDNKPENEPTDERPKFDGNLDDLDLGDEEDEQEQPEPVTGDIEEVPEEEIEPVEEESVEEVVEQPKKKKKNR